MIFYSLYELFTFKEWLIFTASLLFFIHIIWNKNSANFPPGPLPLPFLGNVFTGGDYKTMNKVRFFFFKFNYEFRNKVVAICTVAKCLTNTLKYL